MSGQALSTMLCIVTRRGPHTAPVHLGMHTSDTVDSCRMSTRHAASIVHGLKQRKRSSIQLYMHVCISTFLPIAASVSVYPSVLSRLPLYLALYLSIIASLHLSVLYRSIYLSMSTWPRLSLSLSPFLSPYLVKTLSMHSACS